MPKRTDISSILIIGAGRARTPSPPRGEGRGEGEMAAVEYSTGAAHPHPTSPRQPSCQGFVSFSLEGEDFSSREKVSGETDFAVDRFQNTFDIRQDFMVPETDDAIAMRFHDARPHRVRATFGMLSAIKLDNEPRARTEKIDNITIDGNLPAEFRSEKLSVAQAVPQQLFRFGHVSAQLSGRCGQPPLRHKFPLPGGERVRVRGGCRQLGARPRTLIQLRLGGAAAKPSYPSPSREKAWSINAQKN